MTGKLDEISESIGGVKADIRNLARSIDDDRETNNEFRDAMRKVIESLSSSVRTLTSEVAEIKPEFMDYKMKKAEARGAARATKLIYTGTMAMGGFIGAASLEVARYFHFLPK